MEIAYNINHAFGLKTISEWTAPNWFKNVVIDIESLEDESSNWYHPAIA